MLSVVGGVVIVTKDDATIVYSAQIRIRGTGIIESLRNLVLPDEAMSDVSRIVIPSHHSPRIIDAIRLGLRQILNIDGPNEYFPTEVLPPRLGSESLRPMP